MRKVLISILFVFIYCAGNSQNTTTQNLGAPRTLVVNKGGLKSDSSLITPSFPDTASANLSQFVNYYPGNVIRVDNTLYMRNSSATAWIKVGGQGGSTFENDIIMNADANNRLGYWVNGDTIPVAGKSLDEAFQVITQKAVHPTYYPPSVTISSSPSSGTYEIGYNLGTITFSKTFSQNDAGSENSTTYKRGGTSLPSNTDTCSFLSSSRSYTVTVGYGIGACKNNNLGEIDCYGRIEAGDVTSSQITFTPMAKRYWGYVTSYGSPSSANILAATGGGSGLSTSKAGTFTINVSGSNRYLYYAYPTSYGTLTSLLVGGFETLPAFSPPFTVSVTNAQGYTQNYYVYMNVNPFNAGAISFTTQ
jgi:hypothetical protein